MSLRGRVRAALLASLLGWLAGMAAGLPFQMVEAVRNASTGPRLAYDVAIVLILWLALTFSIAAYWCGFFLLPIVWLVSAQEIVRHRWLLVAASLLFGVVLMAVRLHVWTTFEHDGVSIFNFCMWAVFAGTFFAGTAEMYARLLRTGAGTRACP